MVVGTNRAQAGRIDGKRPSRHLPSEASGAGAATVAKSAPSASSGFRLSRCRKNLLLGLARKLPVWSAEERKIHTVSEAELTPGLDHRILDGAPRTECSTAFTGCCDHLQSDEATLFCYEMVLRTTY